MGTDIRSGRDALTFAMAAAGELAQRKNPEIQAGIFQSVRTFLQETEAGREFAQASPGFSSLIATGLYHAHRLAAAKKSLSAQDYRKQAETAVEAKDTFNKFAQISEDKAAGHLEQAALVEADVPQDYREDAILSTLAEKIEKTKNAPFRSPSPQ